MSQKSCCVPGCPITLKDGVTLHRFPNPKTHADKFKAWISNIGGEITALDQIMVHKNRRVCRRHFEDTLLYPHNRLCKLAVPVLHMPGVQKESEQAQKQPNQAQVSRSKRSKKKKTVLKGVQKESEQAQEQPNQTQVLRSTRSKKKKPY